jgi:prohibitin 2
MNRAREVFKAAAAAGQKMGAGAPGGPGPSGDAISKGIFAIGGLALGGYGLLHSIVSIQPGHVGIVYNRFGGLQESATLGVGYNIVVPWFQRAVIFDMRTRPQTMNTQSGSKG